MWRNIKILVLYMLVLSITSGLSFAQQEPNNAITLESLLKVTKGFPVVLKVTFAGPLRTQDFSINENGIQITVRLISKADKKEFIIKSSIPHYTFTSRDGTQIPSYQLQPFLDIQKDQKYIMMFDLWSLYPVPPSGTTLSDIPQGKYTIYVEPVVLPSFGINIEELFPEKNYTIQDVLDGKVNIFDSLPKYSNSIDIELIEPTEKEKQFIEKVLKLSDTSFKGGINWTRILQRRIVITEKSISGLSLVSKEQISLHKLLSRVDITDDRSKAISLKNVRDATLPKFFEPERLLLLLELIDNPADIREQLLKQYPAYKWNIESKESDNGLIRLRKRSPNETVQTLDTLIESNLSNQRNYNRQPNNRPRNIGNSTQ